tara:strand:- start:1142 stop:1336 length:195 start_codon:yes stop_codon:yes gene_type:complete
MNDKLKLLIDDGKNAVVNQQNAHQDLQASLSLEIERLIQTAFYAGMDEGIAGLAKRLNIALEEI